MSPKKLCKMIDISNARISLHLKKSAKSKVRFLRLSKLKKNSVQTLKTGIPRVNQRFVNELEHSVTFSINEIWESLNSMLEQFVKIPKYKFPNSFEMIVTLSIFYT
jgi:hypothetical protein